MARLIAPILGLTDAQVADQAAAYRQAVELERTTADLPETAFDPLAHAALGGPATPSDDA